jgi:hypothetical protein
MLDSNESRNAKRVQSFLPWTIRALIICAGIVAFVWLAGALGGYLLSQSDVYQEAVAKAKADPEVVRALGTPIQDHPAGASGEISTRGESGTADIVIPLSGPNGNGVMQASARKENGVWVYYTLLVEVNGKDILLEK